VGEWDLTTPGVRKIDRTPTDPVRAAWDRFYRESRKMRKAWKGCEACPPEKRDPNAWLEIHHIISQRRLKRLAVERKLPQMRKLDLLTDPRNSIVLCRDCHHRHTVAHEAIALDAIPRPAWEFADELGLRGEVMGEYRK
jgi:5-methylcytosine-specific restriction endonuclease McrA